jgi:UDP-N-acetylmuramoylalanine--D-glutamate ligase
MQQGVDVNLADYLHKEARILVVGLGFRTGLHSANFLADRGYAVSVSDIKTHEELHPIASQLNPDIKIYAGNQEAALLDIAYDLIVLSPGVPVKTPLIQKAFEKGIPVISEVELAYHYMRGSLIAITGTDGKSTTTALLNYVLQQVGVASYEGGNIGIPLISLVEKLDDASVTVAELSSFQLETIDSFKPDVAAILNVSPDHLDRYDSMHEYFQAKCNITREQTGDDYFVYNADDVMLADAVQTAAQCRSFSLKHRDADVYFEDQNIYMNLEGGPVPVLDCARLQLLGLHNIQNVMASLLMIASLYQKLSQPLPLEKIVAACYSFKGLPHRMEKVGTFAGRNFINDSKATTVGAVQMALQSLNSPAICIIGGRAKGDDYSRLVSVMKDKVKAIILIGETSREFAEIFSSYPQRIAESMEDALVKSMQFSSAGDIILLSPACASFDMYKSFEERGEVFKTSFQKLQKGELQWT